jgi:PKD repeat protein
VTPPELRSPALPESGPALWTDVSPPIASTTTADPILVTDQSTGRTFVSNQTTGTQALFAYSDDDGATWTDPVVGLPDGGADHESIGVGPYPAALSGLATSYPNAVYYCSQAQVPDMCQRSDTGGLTWGPGVVAAAGTGCQSLHGHIKVAPNGTVYLPNRSCGGSQGGVMSTNGGTTWSQFNVPGSGGSSSDPSLGVDSNNTVYYCYTPNDGSAHVAISHDGGQTWSSDRDIGAAAGVKQAVFPEAVAGDPGRAACGFVGTDTAGNFGSTSFPGKWYLFIASTYDGGNTWTTVNATPNDPVQGAGGICLSGIACTGNNRNLLDFNEVTIDKQGRVLFGYDDGCVTAHCLETGGAANDFVAYARIARQTGGKSLFAKYDSVEPASPKQPYLTGTRDQYGSTLTWNPGDNGGSAVTDYQVWRGTTSGGETQIANVSGEKNSYTDTTASASVSDYYYKVVEVTAVGSSPASNEVDLKVVDSGPKPTPCKAPGLTILTDGTGDSLTGTPGTDLHSLQISQPYSATGGKLTFQLNTDPGTNPQPPNSYWYVSFKAPDGVTHGVRMWYAPTSPTQPTFESYIAGANTSGGVDGRFVKAGSEKLADASSSYDAANGKIVIVVPLADVGLKEGDSVYGFNAAAVQAVSTPAVGGAEVVDGMPDALAYSGSYAVVTNSSCTPNTAPTAALTGTPTSGTAPLTVAFDGSGSHDPDAGDSVASYTFNFGDGTASVTQSTPTASHTYTSGGHYQPSLTVTDTHGAASTNSATVTVNVTNPPVVFEDDDAHIAYDNGWHSVSSSSASAGHFHTSSGKGASFAFSTSVANGSLTYYYGTSSKGGSADLYLDGKLVQSVSYKGAAGDGHSPLFGVSVNVPLTTSGSHTFELRNVQGLAYLDKLAVTDGVSQAQPATSPGQTQTSSSSLSPAAAQSSTVTVPANAVGLSVLTESSVSVPYTLAVLNTAGSVLTTVKSGTNGIASVQLPVSGGAKYVVQLLDVGVGPVSVWSATTPQLRN